MVKFCVVLKLTDCCKIDGLQKFYVALVDRCWIYRKVARLRTLRNNIDKNSNIKTSAFGVLCFVYNNEELEVFQVFDTANERAMHRFVRHLSSFGKVVSPMDFKPKTALIVTKVSRYEFERHKHKELSEIDFEHLLTNRGSDYTMIRLAFLSFFFCQNILLQLFHF